MLAVLPAVDNSGKDSGIQRCATPGYKYVVYLSQITRVNTIRLHRLILTVIAFKQADRTLLRIRWVQLRNAQGKAHQVYGEH